MGKPSGGQQAVGGLLVFYIMEDIVKRCGLNHL